MDDDHYFQLFQQSSQRCTEDPNFLGRFYQLFLESSQEVAEKFKHTDFAKQKKMLKNSLFMIMWASQKSPEEITHLQEIAKSHSREKYDVRPELYDLWLECLLQAVEEFDPIYCLEVKKAWQNILKNGIEFMKNNY